MTRRTFTTTIDLSPAFGELLDIPSDWSVDDEDPPMFISAQLGNLELDEAQLMQMVGYDEVSRINKEVAAWWAEEGYAQAVADERDDYGDWLRDQRMDR